MARTADPTVAERNARIVEDYRGNRKQSYEDLCNRYHVDKSTLYLVLRDANVIDKSDRKPRGRVAEAPPLNNTLVLLGRTLEKRVHDRYLEQGSDPDWSSGVAAHVIGVKSAQYLGLIFKGQANVSFLELQAIAKFLGFCSVGPMITEIEDKVCRSLGIKLDNTGS